MFLLALCFYLLGSVVFLLVIVGVFLIWLDARKISKLIASKKSKVRVSVFNPKSEAKMFNPIHLLSGAAHEIREGFEHVIEVCTREFREIHDRLRRIEEAVFDEEEDPRFRGSAVPSSSLAPVQDRGDGRMIPVILPNETGSTSASIGESPSTPSLPGGPEVS